MFVLHNTPLATEVAKEELVPTDGVLLRNKSLNQGLRKLVKGKRGVMNPGIDASNEDACQDFTGFQRGTAGLECLIQGCSPGSTCWVATLQEMQSILEGLIARGALMTVGGFVPMNLLARGEEVVQELDNKSIFRIEFPNRLAMGGPVDQIECLVGPTIGGANVFAEFWGSSSMLSNFLHTRSNSGIVDSELNWVRAQTDGNGAFWGVGKMEVSGKLVSIDIELGL